MLSEEAVAQMIAANIGSATPIAEVVTWVFGKRRTRDALRAPETDPEFVEFVMRIDAIVNKAWMRRGVSRRLGPYVNPVNIVGDHQQHAT